MGFAIGGAVLAGAAMSSSASQNAASAQAGAANQAANVAMQQYGANATAQLPYTAVGQNAIYTLSQEMNGTQANPYGMGQAFTAADYQQSPGYAFQLQQGQNAIQASAAAKGMLNSTGTQQNLLSYSQGLANQDYQQAYQNYMGAQQQNYNMWMGMAGLGQAGAANQAASGNQMVNSYGSAMNTVGSAQAAGAMGQSNAINTGIGNAANGYMNYNTMNSMQSMMANNNPNIQNLPGGGYQNNNPQYSVSGGELPE